MWVPCYSVRTTTPPQRAAGPEPAGPGYFGAGPRQCSLNAPDAYLRKSVSRMCFAVRRLSAAIVRVGLAVAPVGNVLLPTR
jgi:hypothetical protein